MNKYNKIVFVNGSAPPLNADNLNHMDDGIEQATNGAIALETEITTARGDSADLNTRFTADEASLEAVKSEITTARGSSNSLGARLNGIDSAVTNKAEKSTVSQLSARMQTAEKALTGKANATDVGNALKSKEDNLNKVSSKTGITDSSTNYPSIKYLDDFYYDANEAYSSEETDKLLATKYDSSNIESGTSTLTPYSTVADKIKSASCTYKTIGDIVIVSATVKMNATTIGANSTYPLIDLPYKCISEDNVFCVGISNLGKVFKFAVLKNNTWLQFQTQDKTAYTFADGEQINVICSYKIK